MILFTRTHIHVENAVKENQMIVVEEAEPKYQEPQEHKAAGQDLEQDFTNLETQQGKPRCI